MITREYWYKQTFILLEIAKQLREKELCFIEKVSSKLEGRRAKVMRCGQGYTIDLIKTHFEAFSFLKYPNYNMYLSLMDFRMMPVFSFAPPKRKEQYKEWTEGGYKEHFNGYDWAIDIDHNNPLEAYKDAKKVKKLFDQYQLPYSVKFSGSKGFHFIIKYKHLPQLDREKIVSLLSELTHKIRIIDKIPCIDDSIIDDRRVLKLAYSWDRGKICLPLDDELFKNFHLDYVKPDWVLKHIKIMNRGLLTRNDDQMAKKSISNFWELAENFIDIKRWKK